MRLLAGVSVVVFFGECSGAARIVETLGSGDY